MTFRSPARAYRGRALDAVVTTQVKKGVQRREKSSNLH